MENYYNLFHPKFIIIDENVHIKSSFEFDVKSYEIEEYNEKIYNKILNYLEEKGIEKFWSIEFYLKYVTKYIEENISKEEIPILPLSTGVDSTTLSVLLCNIMKRRIKCIYIDTGLNRVSDYEDLDLLEKEYPLLDIERVDISNEVIYALKDVYQQEAKKSIVKEYFRKKLDTTIKQYTNIKKYKLIHGSIATDTFNLFQENKDIIAPLNCLVKSEVRELGRRLGLSSRICNKLKFPVIGYGRKIVGEITKDKLDKVKEIDYQFCKIMIEKNIEVLNAQYIDVSIISNDGINILVYRVDRRIIDKKIISYNDIIDIVRKIELKYNYIDKSLLDISNDTDVFLVRR